MLIITCVLNLVALLCLGGFGHDSTGGRVVYTLLGLPGIILFLDKLGWTLWVRAPRNACWREVIMGRLVRGMAAIDTRVHAHTNTHTTQHTRTHFSTHAHRCITLARTRTRAYPLLDHTTLTSVTLCRLASLCVRLTLTVSLQ